MNDTISLLYAIGVYFACFLLMFINYGSFAVTVVRWAKDPIVKKGTMKIQQPPMTAKETLKCYIPLYQAVLVRKTLYHTAGKLFPIMSWFSTIGIILNLINKFIWAINPLVMLIFNFVMMISVIMFYLVYSIITADCAHMYGFSWVCIILCFLMPHVFCWYLHNNIPRKMKAIHKEEIFSEHSRDTVIRQQHSE